MLIHEWTSVNQSVKSKRGVYVPLTVVEKHFPDLLGKCRKIEFKVENQGESFSSYITLFQRNKQAPGRDHGGGFFWSWGAALTQHMEASPGCRVVFSRESGAYQVVCYPSGVVNKPQAANEYPKRQKLAGNPSKKEDKDSQCLLLDARPLEVESKVQQIRSKLPINKYSFWQKEVLERLHKRAEKLEPNYGEVAVSIHKKFSSYCLDGKDEDGAVPSSEAMHEVIRDYHQMLKRVYADLVLDPHVLPASSLLCNDDPARSQQAQRLHMLRMTNRRFMVFTPAEAEQSGEDKNVGKSKKDVAQQLAGKAAESNGSESAVDTRVARSGDEAEKAQTDDRGKVESNDVGKVETDDGGKAETDDGGKDGTLKSQHPAEGDDAVGSQQTWLGAMRDMWNKIQVHLKGKGTAAITGRSYRHVRANDDPLRFSCNMMDTVWEAGCVKKMPLPGTAMVLQEMYNSEAGTRGGRLYFTDGTIPAYAAMNLPDTVPGICCHINNDTNAVLPHAIRSSRGDNVLNFMKVESTGTACWVFFAPIGGGCNITAFHQETKKRRSFNCGTGDFIIQPLATASNVSRLQHVNAAVTGKHKRHGQVLPCEFYLEEGIPLVLYLRDREYSEMVELSEQSCHSFLSFSYISSPVPSFKVSCNDWCLRWEVSSAYFMEELAVALGRYIEEEAPPDDGADTWTESSYFTTGPTTLAARAGWKRPWSDELDLTDVPNAWRPASQVRGGKGKEPAGEAGNEAKANKEQVKEEEREDDQEEEEEEEEVEEERTWRMPTVAVRTAERLTDLLSGRLIAQPFTGELPSASTARVCLRNLLPALIDMTNRCLTEEELTTRANAPADTTVTERTEEPAAFDTSKAKPAGATAAAAPSKAAAATAGKAGAVSATAGSQKGLHTAGSKSGSKEAAKEGKAAQPAVRTRARKQAGHRDSVYSKNVFFGDIAMSEEQLILSSQQEQGSVTKGSKEEASAAATRGRKRRSREGNDTKAEPVRDDIKAQGVGKDWGVDKEQWDPCVGEEADAEDEGPAAAKRGKVGKDAVVRANGSGKAGCKGLAAEAVVSAMMEREANVEVDKESGPAKRKWGKGAGKASEKEGTAGLEGTNVDAPGEGDGRMAEGRGQKGEGKGQKEEGGGKKGEGRAVAQMNGKAVSLMLRKRALAQGGDEANNSDNREGNTGQAAAVTAAADDLSPASGDAVAGGEVQTLDTKPPPEPLPFSKEYMQLVLKEALEVLDAVLPDPLVPQQVPDLCKCPDVLVRYLLTDPTARSAVATELQDAIDCLSGDVTMPIECLHSLWLFCLKREWEEAVKAGPNPMVMSQCRWRRSQMECLFDAHCTAQCKEIESPS